MNYKSIYISTEEKEILRGKFIKLPDVVPFSSDPKYFSRLAALGIHQEIGTIHDELSKFLFDAVSGVKIPAETLRSEMIEFRGYTGVRIWSEGFTRLDPRVRGLWTLLHPELSFDSSGHIYQCVFFPESIMKIAALDDTEIVSVKPWGLNTIFGGFDPSKTYYEGNMWEFINIDAVRYSRLLENRQIVFWGTHDLVSHIAGVKKSAWPELQARGKNARILFEAYFNENRNPVPYALVLPYALGMLLDDLAQPMNYESESRRYIVDLLMTEIRAKRIKANVSPFLLKYPPSIESLILLARSDDVKKTREIAKDTLNQVLNELHQFSLLAA